MTAISPLRCIGCEHGSRLATDRAKNRDWDAAQELPLETRSRVIMARIRTVLQTSSVVVVVQGRLGAADMRRLEDACAPALITPHADLTVDVQHATVIDRVAQAHLNRIETRGAVILRGPEDDLPRPGSWDPP